MRVACPVGGGEDEVLSRYGHHTHHRMWYGAGAARGRNMSMVEGIDWCGY